MSRRTQGVGLGLHGAPAYKPTAEEHQSGGISCWADGGYRPHSGATPDHVPWSGTASTQWACSPPPQRAMLEPPRR